MEFQRSVAIIENSRFGQFLQRLTDWRPHQLHKEVRDKTLSASEVIQLAAQLGLNSEKDWNEYGALLKVVLRLELPKDWKRERDPEGNFQYNHVPTKVTTSQHPTVYKMRVAFLEMLKLSKLPDKAQHQLSESSPSEGEQENDLNQFLDIDLGWSKNQSNSRVQLRSAKKSSLSLKGSGFENGPSRMTRLGARAPKIKRQEARKIGGGVIGGPRDRGQRGEMLHELRDRVHNLVIHHKPEGKWREEKALMDAAHYYELAFGKDIDKFKDYIQALPKCQDTEEIEGFLKYLTQNTARPSQLLDEPDLEMLCKAALQLPLPPMWELVVPHLLQPNKLKRASHLRIVRIHPRRGAAADRVLRSRDSSVSSKEEQDDGSVSLTDGSSAGTDWEASVSAGGGRHYFFSLDNVTVKTHPSVRYVQRLLEESNQFFVAQGGKRERVRKMRREYAQLLADLEKFDVATNCFIDVGLEPHLMNTIAKTMFDMKTRFEHSWEMRHTVEGETYWFNSVSGEIRRTYPFVKEVEAAIESKRTELAGNKLIKKLKRTNTSEKTSDAFRVNHKVATILKQECSRRAESLLGMLLLDEIKKSRAEALPLRELENVLQKSQDELSETQLFQLVVALPIICKQDVKRAQARKVLEEQAKVKQEKQPRPRRDSGDSLDFEKEILRLDQKYKRKNEKLFEQLERIMPNRALRLKRTLSMKFKVNELKPLIDKRKEWRAMIKQRPY